MNLLKAASTVSLLTLASRVTGLIREQLIAAGQGNRWASIPAFARTVTPAGAVVPVFDEDDEGELIEVATKSPRARRRRRPSRSA